MPKVFSETDRENIREALLENGRKALEKDSYNETAAVMAKAITDYIFGQ